MLVDRRRAGKLRIAVRRVRTPCRRTISLPEAALVDAGNSCAAGRSRDGSTRCVVGSRVQRSSRPSVSSSPPSEANIVDRPYHVEDHAPIVTVEGVDGMEDEARLDVRTTRCRWRPRDEEAARPGAVSAVPAKREAVAGEHRPHREGDGRSRTITKRAVIAQSRRTQGPCWTAIGTSRTTLPVAETTTWRMASQTRPS